MDAHSFAARNFAHLYAVSGRQHKRLWLRMQGSIGGHIEVKHCGVQSS